MEWEHKSFLKRKMRKLLCKPRYKKGVAGLNVLLSVIIMLFIIGFLVMIFAMMGGELEDEDTISESEGPYTIINDTVIFPTGVGGVALTSCTGGVAPHITSILAVTNATGTGGELVPANNYTFGKCLLYTTGASNYNSTAHSVNVSYVFASGGVAFTTINATYAELAEVTDWFGIIIVITAMVVLILLTVIIISAIRGTGLVGLGEEGKPPRETA